MKFGISLEKGIEAKFRDWKSYAIQYNAMKRLLLEEEEMGLDASEIGKSDSPNASPTGFQSVSEKAGAKMARSFWTVYEKSLSSINDFYEEQGELCKTKLKDLQNRVKILRLSVLQRPEAERRRIVQTSSNQAIIRDLKEFRDEIDLILEFLEINNTACRKIVKKYDKRRSCNQLEVCMSQLRDSHSFLFGGGLISEQKRKVDSMLQKLESWEYAPSLKKGNQSGSPYDVLSKTVLSKAQSVLDEINLSPMFLSNQVRSNPTFDREEIQIGPFLGEGEFGSVHEIVAFHVKDTCPICYLHQQLEGKEKNNIADLTEFENDHIDEAEELVSNRGFMKEHCMRNGSARYAIKEVKTSLKGTALADGAIDICIEAKILSVISHPNIIKLCGISKINGVDPRSFIIMDRLYGTLGDRIDSWKNDVQPLTKGLFASLRNKKDLDILFNERLLAMYDIARAMKYLHSKDIIYRDLKPENAGFDVRGNVKLFDFGLAKELQSKDNVGLDQYKSSGRTGTRRYMSPENMLCKPYGKPTDMYSFGILLWETLSLEKPFQGLGREKHAKEVVLKGKRPSIPQNWPIFIKSMTKNTWAADPSARPDFRTVCQIIKGELTDANMDKNINLSDRTTHLMDMSLVTRQLHS